MPGHLTVFAELSHHAVRSESRIFSSLMLVPNDSASTRGESSFSLPQCPHYFPSWYTGLDSVYRSLRRISFGDHFSSSTTRYIDNE